MCEPKWTGPADGSQSVYLASLGCRLNESEIERLAEQFAQAGWQIVLDPSQAHLCIVNTCTVTGEAGRKSRQLIRRLNRQNPQTQIVVTGCHATLFPQEIQDLPGVLCLLDNDEKQDLVGKLLGSFTPQTDAPPGPSLLKRARAFVKIQDGCDNHCTYCITTIARGPGRSRPANEVVAEVSRLEAWGYQEVVLTGVHLGSFGHDWGQTDALSALVLRLLCETQIPRLRLSSLEPWNLSPNLLELWSLSGGRLCRQLHLPLQSGCDATLRRMGRRITSAEFAQLVNTAHQLVPDLAVTTDLIVGFPGETHEEFEQSYQFVAQLGFARLHVFPYSPRPGTAAARLPDQTPAQVKATQSRRLRQLGKRQAAAFRRSFIGRVLPVLWYRRSQTGLCYGLTDNYLQIVTTCTRQSSGQVTPVRLVELQADCLRGEIISSETNYAG